MKLVKWWSEILPEMLFHDQRRDVERDWNVCQMLSNFKKKQKIEPLYDNRTEGKKLLYWSESWIVNQSVTVTRIPRRISQQSDKSLNYWKGWKNVFHMNVSILAWILKNRRRNRFIENSKFFLFNARTLSKRQREIFCWHIKRKTHVSHKFITIEERCLLKDIFME